MSVTIKNKYDGVSGGTTYRTNTLSFRSTYLGADSWFDDDDLVDEEYEDDPTFQNRIGINVDPEIQSVEVFIALPARGGGAPSAPRN